MSNIYPIFEKLVTRKERETRLGQQSVVVWMTGLSGSGKSTIAGGLERVLFNQGFQVQVLDGDNVRSGLNNNLGFSIEDRTENIRRVGELAKLYLNSGYITICSFISPTNEIRSMVRTIVGDKDFLEVFIDTPIELCESRDAKGLYKKARAGEIKGFTGIDSPYEIPQLADIVIQTKNQEIEQSVAKLVDFLLPKIRIV